MILLALPEERKRRRSFLLSPFSLSFFIFIILLLLFLWIPLFPMLQITLPDNHQIVWSRPISNGETFTLRFTHSVERTEVDEVFRAEGDSILVDSSIYRSFGAGLPDQPPPGAKMTLKDGKLIISHIDQRLPFIDVRIGQVIANHQLIYRGKSYPLKEIAPPGSAVRIGVGRANLLTWLERR